MVARSLHDDVFLYPEERHELLTTFFVWQGLRTLDVSTWQERDRVGWDATDGRNGGAEPLVWEKLLEMERFDYRAGEHNPGAITLVLDLATNCVGLGAHCNSLTKILRVLRGYFEHKMRVQFEGCVAEPLQTITALLPESQWSCLLLRSVLQVARSGRVRRGAAPDHYGSPPWVAMELLAPSQCVASCTERSDECVSVSEAEGFLWRIRQPS